MGKEQRRLPLSGKGLALFHDVLAPVEDLASDDLSGGIRHQAQNAKSGGGQMLICVGGRGFYQEEGKEARELHPGDVVNIPANVESIKDDAFVGCSKLQTVSIANSNMKYTDYAFNKTPYFKAHSKRTNNSNPRKRKNTVVY